MNTPIQTVDIDLTTTDLHDKEGNRLTEEFLETLADEAEKQGIPAGLIPGGKSLSGGSKHSPKFQLILGEESAEKVKQRAASEHMSVSRWLRRTVEEKLAA